MSSRVLAIVSKQTQYIVYASLIVISAEKSNFIYILQYWNRNQLSRLINEGFDLHRHLCTMCKGYELPAKYKMMLKTKLLAVCLQTAIIISVTFSFESITYNVLVLLYSNWTSLLMSSTIFCGLFVIWQFYLMLNHKLKQCMAEVKEVSTMGKAQQMRMQRFCDLSDDIDRLGCLHARCLTLTEQMNQFFSATLFVTLFYAFVVTLSQLFFIYGMIARKVMGLNVDTMNDMYSSCLRTLFYTLEIYFIVSVSNEVINEGRKPGLMLFFSAEDIDDRLSRSVSNAEVLIKK